MSEKRRETGLTRRQAMKRILAGGAGLAMAGHLAPLVRAADEAPKPSTGRGGAKAIIQIWMWGGPPHTDTFDPKPGAGDAYHATGSVPIFKEVVATVSPTRSPTRAPAG